MKTKHLSGTSCAEHWLALIQIRSLSSAFHPFSHILNSSHISPSTQNESSCFRGLINADSPLSVDGLHPLPMSTFGRGESNPRLPGIRLKIDNLLPNLTIALLLIFKLKNIQNPTWDGGKPH